MHGRARALWAAAGVLALTLVPARLFLFPPDQLVPSAVDTTTGVHSARVGDRVNVFLGGFEPKGRAEVRVRDIRATDVPSGIRIVAIHALHKGPMAGTVNGDLEKEQPGAYDLRPVTDMVFEPGEPQEWTIVVVIEAVDVGSWRTTGIEVAWQAGWYRGTTRFPYRVGMDVTRAA